MPDLSHTPGLYYAVAHWFSCTFYVAQASGRRDVPRQAAVHAVFFPTIGAFMFLTDGVPAVWFLPCISAIILLILLDIKLASGLGWMKSGYLCIRAFILGEFAASLEWQLFYFGLTVLGLPLRMWVNLTFLLLTHGAVFGIMYLLDRKHRSGYQLDITWHELSTALFICLGAFAASNLSYLSQSTPLSGQLTADIFIIRTLVDLGGVAMLHAHHAQLQELKTALEVANLQNVLYMQYENYRISEDSIALVNQKYHDLKHHIQLLRSEISTGKMLEYLDQMEEEIRTYEAQNKTGNQVLDTILTAKSLQCQRAGVSLTCVADGQALGFMHPMDISALFGNALDNALESAKKLDDPEKRLIHLSVAQQKGFLRIRVENCYAGELRLVAGMPASTKRDGRYHGFGLKSIRDTAAKYGGSMTIAAKDGWFELRILFPLPPAKEPLSQSGSVG